MRSTFARLLFVTLFFAGCRSGGDVTLGKGDATFVLSGRHGSVVSGQYAGAQVMVESYDSYILESGEDAQRSSEQGDVVVEREQTEGECRFVCRSSSLGLVVRKSYRLREPGILEKTISLQQLPSAGKLSIRSVVRLASTFRRGGYYYCERQSWRAPGGKELFGVRPADGIRQESESLSGWDNRFVVFFHGAASPALNHYRLALNGTYVVASAVVAQYGKAPAGGLRYTPDGWDFEAIHVLPGDPRPRSATIHYSLFRGDWLAALRRYGEIDEVRQTMNLPMPGWVDKLKFAGFLHLPDRVAEQTKAAHALAEKLKGGYLALGIFGWSLDGDYETDVTFLNEPNTLAMTPGFFGKCLDNLQVNKHVKVGPYFQGGLIDSESKAYKSNPDWALQGADGKPLFSGFRDNKLGRMYFFNPYSGFRKHFMSRVRAVMRRYNPGWIYVDGGAAMELDDYRLRRCALADVWVEFVKELRRTIRRENEDCALLLNAQNMQFGDMRYLECPYLNPGTPWRETVDFCFEAAIRRRPENAILPLYWREEERYLAMCAACGFTPTTSANLADFTLSDSQWRAVEASYIMRQGAPVLDSKLVQPNWWLGGSEVVCWVTKIGDQLVVPVLNFGDSDVVEIEVALDAQGLPRTLGRDQVWAYLPLQGSEVLPVHSVGSAGSGRAVIRLDVPAGFGGVTLLTLNLDKKRAWNWWHYGPGPGKRGPVRGIASRGRAVSGRSDPG